MLQTTHSFYMTQCRVAHSIILLLYPHSQKEKEIPIIIKYEHFIFFSNKNTSKEIEGGQGEFFRSV